jgi:hypothetical protein
MLVHPEPRSLEVRLRGGTLKVDWPGPELPVVVAGPAVETFSGEVEV